MINTEKYRRISYNADIKTIKWMEKNVKPQNKSKFIRDAIAEKINKPLIPLKGKID